MRSSFNDSVHPRICFCNQDQSSFKSCQITSRTWPQSLISLASSDRMERNCSPWTDDLWCGSRLSICFTDLRILFLQNTSLLRCTSPPRHKSPETVHTLAQSNIPIQTQVTDRPQVPSNSYTSREDPYTLWRNLKDSSLPLTEYRYIHTVNSRFLSKFTQCILLSNHPKQESATHYLHRKGLRLIDRSWRVVPNSLILWSSDELGSSRLRDLERINLTNRIGLQFEVLPWTLSRYECRAVQSLTSASAECTWRYPT